MTSSNFIASQHLPGMLNLIADWLSFQGTERVENGTSKQNPVAYDCPPNDVITNRIVISFPQLVPADFRISHLPNKILSFASQAVQIFESSLTQKLKAEQKHTTESGGAGPASARISSTTNTPALLEYPQRKLTISYGPSLRFTGNQTLLSQERLLTNVRSRWSQILSKKSSALWARRCGTVTGNVPFTSKTVETADTQQISRIC